jgi:hypothetical protein
VENSGPLGVAPRRLENCVSCAMGEDGPKRENPDAEFRGLLVGLGLLVSSTASIFMMETMYLLQLRACAKCHRSMCRYAGVMAKTDAA